MTPDQSTRLLLLLAALVLPAAAVMRRRRLGWLAGRSMLLWIVIIGLAWLVAAIGPPLLINLT